MAERRSIVAQLIAEGSDEPDEHTEDWLVPSMAKDFASLDNASDKPAIPEDIGYDEAVRASNMYNLIMSEKDYPWFGIHPSIVRNAINVAVYYSVDQTIFPGFSSIHEAKISALAILNPKCFCVDDISYSENSVFLVMRNLSDNQKFWMSKAQAFDFSLPVGDTVQQSVLQSQRSRPTTFCISREIIPDVYARRWWFSYAMWLRFCNDHFIYAFTTYANYLIHSGQNFEFRELLKIRMIPLMLFAHPAAIPFWQYTFTYMSFNSEVKFFLDNCHKFLDGVNEKLRVYIMDRGEDYAYVMRTNPLDEAFMIDNTDVADGLTFLSSRIGQQDWYRSSSDRFIKYKRFEPNELFSIKDLYSRYFWLYPIRINIGSQQNNDAASVHSIDVGPEQQLASSSEEREEIEKTARFTGLRF